MREGLTMEVRDLLERFPLDTFVSYMRRDARTTG